VVLPVPVPVVDPVPSVGDPVVLPVPGEPVVLPVPVGVVPSVPVPVGDDVVPFGVEPAVPVGLVVPEGLVPLVPVEFTVPDGDSPAAPVPDGPVGGLAVGMMSSPPEIEVEPVEFDDVPPDVVLCAGDDGALVSCEDPGVTVVGGCT